MVKFQTVKQKARIILNSEDAIKTQDKEYIIPIRGDPIRFDGALGIVTDINTEFINILNHKLVNDETVIYSSSGTVMPGLTNGTTYYVKVISDFIIQLSLTSGGAAVNITGLGTGTHTLARTITFDGSVDTYLDVANHTFKLGNHRFETGDPVFYTTVNAVIAGLAKDRYYYVIKIDNDTFKLADDFAKATQEPPEHVELTGLGGLLQNLSRTLTFDNQVSAVVDITKEMIKIPAHNFKTGDMVLYQVDTYGFATATPIPPLTDNMLYYVISVDPYTIKLAYNKAQALAGTPINLAGAGIGTNHALTKIVVDPVAVCTNYNFKLRDVPFNLNDKCRMSVQSFDYVRNYNTQNCKNVGGVYLKSLHTQDVYSSQSYRGSLILPAYFGNSFSHQNNDIEFNSIPLPHNMMQILQNGFDVYIDSKKRTFGDEDIEGNIADDTFNLTLVIYEIEDYEPISHELDTKIKNYVNARLI